MTSHGDASENSTGTSYIPYRVLNSFGDSGYVCTTVKFDGFEELLWVGSKEGRLWSYCGLPSLSRYAAFSPAYDGGLRDFCVTDPGILALTGGGLSLHKRRGELLYTLPLVYPFDFQCCLAVPGESPSFPNGTIVVAGKEGLARKLNLDRPDLIENLWIADIDTVLLRACDRFLCFGSHYGDVGIMDLRSNQVRTNRVVPENSVLCDFDVYDYSMSMCVQEVDQMGNVLPTYAVSVYDMRVCKATSPITTSVAPHLARFKPGSYGQYCGVVDMEGKFELVNCYASADGSEAVPQKLGDFSGAPVTVDFSSTGDSLAIGDSMGLVHLLSKTPSKSTTWNSISRPSSMPAVPHQRVSGISAMDPYLLQAAIGDSDHPLLRNRKNSQSWPSTIPAIHVPSEEKTKLAHPEAIADLHLMEYSPAPVSPLLYLRASKDDMSVTRSRSRKPQGNGAIVFRNVSRSVCICGLLGSWKEFNTSALPALEPELPSSYCNGILQVLYNIAPLATVYQNHICFNEFCLTCELGFLFHMMTVAGSEEPCQASNLHRVIRALDEAVDRGLVVADTDELLGGTTPQAITQNWIEFILEHTHQEHLRHCGFTVQDTAISQLASWRVMDTIAHSCGHVTQERHNIFLLPLRYHGAQNYRGQDLHQILRCTLNESSDWLVRCEHCKYESLANFTRRVTCLPETFALNFHLENENNMSAMKQMLANWTIQQMIREKTEKAAVSLTDAKACRYSSQCTRPNCLFIHPKDLELVSTKSEVPSTFIPCSLWMNIGSDGRTEVVSSRPLARHKWTEYEVMGICYISRTKEKSDEPRFVSAVKVKNVSTDAPWHLFDDLIVTPTTQQEALHFELKARIPCTVFYARVDLNERWSASPVNPITRDIFLHYCEQSMPGVTREPSSVIPVQESETFGPDSVVALDAEFVSLSDGEVEMHPDGTISTIKPSMMSLGRVTVIRGGGVLAGTPLMDEYVVARDKIVDHLTEFSGIQPGDLCAHLSSKRLQTLKSVYVRLRYLVDAGVRFIGHGLNNDFRVINLKVPKRQIIDTVQLFRLPDQRLISLRFLAWYFLGTYIQLHSHDSIEDAQSALSLYQKYNALTKDMADVSTSHHGTVLDLLAQMYEIGRSLQWKIPLPQS